MISIEQQGSGKNLPKPVIDRIGRFAREGRQLRSMVGPEGYSLLATAMYRQPVVLARANNAEEFAGIRSAVVSEWSRIRKQTTVISRAS